MSIMFPPAGYPSNTPRTTFTPSPDPLSLFFSSLSLPLCLCPSSLSCSPHFSQFNLQGSTEQNYIIHHSLASTLCLRVCVWVGGCARQCVKFVFPTAHPSGPAAPTHKHLSERWSVAGGRRRFDNDLTDKAYSEKKNNNKFINTF